MVFPHLPPRLRFTFILRFLPLLIPVLVVGTLFVLVDSAVRWTLPLRYDLLFTRRCYLVIDLFTFVGIPERALPDFILLLLIVHHRSPSCCNFGLYLFILPLFVDSVVRSRLLHGPICSRLVVTLPTLRVTFDSTVAPTHCCLNTTYRCDILLLPVTPLTLHATSSHYTPPPAFTTFR